MSEQVLIELDNDTVAELRRRAALTGRSLPEEIRALLSTRPRMSRSEVLAMADRIRAQTPVQKTDSTDLIREDRDSGWRR